MPKKANGFMVFVNEWKAKHGKKLTIQEAINKANELWKGMDEEARAPYRAKGKTQGSHPFKESTKLTCVGVPIMQVQQEEEDKERKIHLMKQHITEMVKGNAMNGTLLEAKFYFIMANYFSENRRIKLYVPAEIALCEFSLKDGVNRTYHTYISPDEDEIFGNLYDAIQHSEATHKLPTPPNALGRSNYECVYNEILNFINCGSKEQLVPLYTNNNPEEIESILDFLYTKSIGDESVHSSPLSIYSLRYLTYTMKVHYIKANENATDSSDQLVSPFTIDAFFDRDSFEYQNNISCDYHEEIDRSKYCALSQVIRWGYMICDFLGKHLNMELIAGRHLPIDTNFEAITNAANSTIMDDGKSISSVNSYRVARCAQGETDADDEGSSTSGWASVSHMLNSNHRSNKPPMRMTPPDPKHFEISCSESIQSDSSMSFNSYVTIGRGRGSVPYNMSDDGHNANRRGRNMRGRGRGRGYLP